MREEYRLWKLIWSKERIYLTKKNKLGIDALDATDALVPLILNDGVFRKKREESEKWFDIRRYIIKHCTRIERKELFFFFF